MKLKKFISLSALLMISAPSFAEPWIESDDPLLRASIEMLFNQGIIKQPINSYPLMWQGIAGDLAAIDPNNLQERSFFAYQHVKHALNNAKRKNSSGVRFNYNSEPETQQGFTTRDQQKSGINSYGSITDKRVSAKVSVNYADESLDGKYTNYHGSYLAVLMGNWSISAEQVSHWWGPSNDNALLLSNNAAPMKGLRFSRANSQYVGPSWLSFIGNWQLTGIYAKQKPFLNSSEEGDYWALRFASTPLKGLEIAVNTASSDYLTDEYIDSVTLESQTSTHRLTSIDVKYSTSIAQQPVAFYADVMGRNESGLAPSDPFYTVGIESYFGSNDSLLKTYFEYSNTEQQCSLTADCVYGSGSYTQKQRLIGSSVPKQSKSAVLGAYYHTLDGYGGHAKLRWIDSVAEVEETPADMTQLQLELGYQQSLFSGLWKVTGLVSRDEIGNDSDTNTGLRTSWEFRF
ncbi:capsule assembly Wzi family protein [Pseudoalteromonas arabiensis]|uniref:capsule assembly Wzi family protein n=1 Tax=Pseudoalteromonas arabiensis TaxID=874454 RepID=UPI000785BB4B|nr:capsule assembly Wzi family protein [Pseudoalteromonas arabiensis]|tara:strand:+ start:726 stop:2102 length:1377 start_codon:yes stop_codon:yes gene_type:complete